MQTEPKAPTFDPVIMAELLEQPGVKEEVAKMEASTLDWYRLVLVTSGIYAKYVKERKAKVS